MKKQKATKNATASNEDFLATGRLLAEVKALNPKHFTTARQSMGLSRRKAYYFIELYKSYHKLEIPKDLLLSVGWTKLQVVSHLVTEDNWKHWIPLAQALAVHELKDVVRGKALEFGKHCVLFYLTPAEFALVAAVLVRHGASREGRAILGKEAALVKALTLLDQLESGGASTGSLS